MSDLESDFSSDHCEVDGACGSKQFLSPDNAKKKTKKKKKKKKKKQIDVSDEEAYSNRSTWEMMRKRTISLMKKTAVYAATTGMLHYIRDKPTTLHSLHAET